MIMIRKMMTLAMMMIMTTVGMTRMMLTIAIAETNVRSDTALERLPAFENYVGLLASAFLEYFSFGSCPTCQPAARWCSELPR